MIRSCDDIKTMDEYKEFHIIWSNTLYMGLNETARMIVLEDDSIVPYKKYCLLK